MPGAPGYTPVVAQFPLAIPSDTDFGVQVNNDPKTLASAITSSTTVITLAEDISTWPSAGVVSIDRERIFYISKDNNAKTITTIATPGLGRGFDGSIPGAHLQAAAVRPNIVAFHFNKLSKELQAALAVIGPSSNYTFVPKTRLVASGDGLQGGGDLSADRTLSVDGTVVRTSRQVATGTGLSGGGDLSANRTLTVDQTFSPTWTGSHTFTHATAGIIIPRIGPASGQQHTIPAVTSDTLALLAATQAMTGKTLDDDSNVVRAVKLHTTNGSPPVVVSGVPVAGQTLVATSGTAAQWTTAGTASVTIQDEGVGQGAATTLNFVGTGVTVSVAGAVATVNVGGQFAPVGSQYLMVAADGTLTNERTLVVSTGLSFIDAGANGNYTVSVDQAFSPSWTGTHTFQDSKLFVADAADATKRLGFDIQGTTGVTGTLRSTFTTAKTLDLPDATDTLMGRATTDTMTGKTYDTAGAGNVFRINGTGITAVSGTGAVALVNSPTFITPSLGAAGASSINGLIITATTGTLTVANGKTASFGNTFSLTTADGATLVFPGTDSYLGRLSVDQGADRVKNKDFEAGTSRFIDSADITKRIRFEAASQAAATTLILASAIAADRTLTFSDHTSASHIPVTAAALAVTNNPTIGHVLTATGANTATWQANAGGGGGGDPVEQNTVFPAALGMTFLFMGA